MALYPSGVLLPLKLLITGWSVENRVHWIWVDVVSVIEFLNSISLIFRIPMAQGLAFVGAGVILVFQNVQTYAIDC